MTFRSNPFLLLLGATATTTLTAATTHTSTTTRPPKAHELTPHYTFSEYLAHFPKRYAPAPASIDSPSSLDLDSNSNPNTNNPDEDEHSNDSKSDEYHHRSKIFYQNLQRILTHNEGRLSEDGSILDGGYVMGVNEFTDLEPWEFRDAKMGVVGGYDRSKSWAWLGQQDQGEQEEQQLQQEHGDQLLRGDNVANVADVDGVAVAERRLGSTSTSYMMPPTFPIEDPSNLPPQIDYSQNPQKAMNPIVPNQGGCGSCWTFAATGVIEAHLALALGQDEGKGGEAGKGGEGGKKGEGYPSLSQEYLLSCVDNPDHCGGEGGCTGATVELAFNFVADMAAKKTGGMFRLEDIPYNATEGVCDLISRGVSPAVGITGWTGLPSNDYKTTMNALAKVGPLAIGVAASSWQHYEKGVFSTNSTDPSAYTVNHAVILAGYGIDSTTGEKYYLVRNSWGPNFGEDGYIRILRTDDDSNVCGMDEDPLTGMACALDEEGREREIKPVKVCSESGVIFDPVYPVGVYMMESEE